LKLEVSGLASLPDGRLAIAIRKGEIWIADQTNDPELTHYTPFAKGLHEPLGLAFHEDAFYTVQRTELTRITDRNNDGTADEYWTVAKGWGVTGNYHEYAYGPQFDLEGNAWITLNIGIGKGSVPEDNAWRGWSIKVLPNGSWSPVSAGFRSPSGIGINPKGDIFATDQQGNWFPTCPLIHVKPGTFHGHADALEHTKRPESSFQWNKKSPKD
jgi:glucose/arabinose dehydrogenase